MCYSIVILFVYKVLSVVMFEGFKVVGVCGVVACKDNGKVGGCGDGCIAGSGGYKVVVGVWGFG